MIVNVTQNDIWNGGHTSLDCPIARAIRRQTGHERISVGVSFAWEAELNTSLPRNGSKFLPLPDVAVEWQLGGRKTPFSFELKGWTP